MAIANAFGDGKIKIIKTEVEFVAGSQVRIDSNYIAMTLTHAACPFLTFCFVSQSWMQEGTAALMQLLMSSGAIKTVSQELKTDSTKGQDALVSFFAFNLNLLSFPNLLHRTALFASFTHLLTSVDTITFRTLVSAGPLSLLLPRPPQSPPLPPSPPPQPHPLALRN